MSTYYLDGLEDKKIKEDQKNTGEVNREFKEKAVWKALRSLGDSLGRLEGIQVVQEINKPCASIPFWFRVFPSQMQGWMVVSSEDYTKKGFASQTCLLSAN